MYSWKKVWQDMDEEEFEAIKELLFMPENENVRIILSKYCYSLPELVATARVIYGLTYKKQDTVEAPAEDATEIPAKKKPAE